MKIEENRFAQAMPSRRTGRKIERRIEEKPETNLNVVAKTEEPEEAVLSMPGRRTARRVERRTIDPVVLDSSERRMPSRRRTEKREVPKTVNPVSVEEQNATEEVTISEEVDSSEILLEKTEDTAPEEENASSESIKETEKKKTASKNKLFGLGGKAIAILVAIAVIVAAIVFGIIFLTGKEKKSSKNYMDQLRTQKIVSCEIEPINQFFTEYYSSLSEGNTTEMEKMFDHPENASVSAAVSTIVEQYSDMDIYYTEGIQENEYAVFVCNNVKFNNIKTPAPSIDCFYVTYSEEDGSVKIVADMYSNPEIIRFVTLASYMEPMRSKLKDTDAALEKALNGDKELNNLYIVMRSMTDAVLSNEAIEQ